jgi:hypothetical protein
MVGTTVGFQDLIIEALGPMIISLNPVAVPIVLYQYYSMSDKRLALATRLTQGLRATVGSHTLGTEGHRL